MKILSKKTIFYKKVRKFGGYHSTTNKDLLEAVIPLLEEIEYKYQKTHHTEPLSYAEDGEKSFMDHLKSLVTKEK